jgi:hypothetical protein
LHWCKPRTTGDFIPCYFILHRGTCKMYHTYICVAHKSVRWVWKDIKYLSWNAWKQLWNTLIWLFLVMLLNIRKHVISKRLILTFDHNLNGEWNLFKDYLYVWSKKKCHFRMLHKTVRDVWGVWTRHLFFRAVVVWTSIRT